MFNFDRQFEIHDDVEVLRRMGLTYGLETGHCLSQQLNMVLELMPTTVHRLVTGLYFVLRHSVFTVCSLITFSD